DLPKSPAVEFEQSARERSYQQPPTIFEQDGHGLRVAIGPAVTFESFPVEDDQPLRAGADEEFGVEDGDRSQIALRKAVERGIAPLRFSVLVELDQSAVGRGEDRAVELRQAASGAAALNQFDFIAGERPPRILLERRERPPLRQRAGRLEFMVGPALDRPPDDQKNYCNQRCERDQGAAT